MLSSKMVPLNRYLVYQPWQTLKKTNLASIRYLSRDKDHNPSEYTNLSQKYIPPPGNQKRGVLRTWFSRLSILTLCAGGYAYYMSEELINKPKPKKPMMVNNRSQSPNAKLEQNRSAGRMTTQLKQREVKEKPKQTNNSAENIEVVKLDEKKSASPMITKLQQTKITENPKQINEGVENTEVVKLQEASAKPASPNPVSSTTIAEENEQVKTGEKAETVQTSKSTAEPVVPLKQASASLIKKSGGKPMKSPNIAKKSDSGSNSTKRVQKEESAKRVKKDRLELTKDRKNRNKSKKSTKGVAVPEQESEAQPEVLEKQPSIKRISPIASKEKDATEGDGIKRRPLKSFRKIERPTHLAKNSAKGTPAISKSGQSMSPMAKRGERQTKNPFIKG